MIYHPPRYDFCLFFLLLLLLIHIANAYISGMEEDLDIEGKQYNWMTVLFMIGYLS